MHMDIAAVVMSVRVGAYKGLVSGEMLFTKLLAQLLCLVYNQAIVGSVTGVKTDNVMVALYVLPLLVLAVFQIGMHTRYGEIFITAIQRGNEIACPWYYLPVFIKSWLHGKLVMLKG